LKGSHAIFERAATTLLLEFLLVDSFSVSLKDFNISKAILKEAWNFSETDPYVHH
jgi:hypothetical protein